MAESLLTFSFEVMCNNLCFMKSFLHWIEPFCFMIKMQEILCWCSLTVVCFNP